MKTGMGIFFDFQIEKMQILYSFISIFALVAGLAVYYFFRGTNILIYEWFSFLPKSDNFVTFSNRSVLTNFFIFNFPSGLWLLSGLMFLRAVCYGHPKTFLMYKLYLLFIAFLFEIVQIFDRIYGTFDIFDLLAMGSVAFLESTVHKIPQLRRLT